ncbi:hypothetical protein B0H11DRAFT_1916226 [Mycena galericulata]|nr:hypothetical protein B0H11DRAFT_1916226 [Mycena galericulata]
MELCSLVMRERQAEEHDPDGQWARFMALGLAILYLGELTFKAMEQPISKATQIILMVSELCPRRIVIRCPYLSVLMGEELSAEICTTGTYHQEILAIGLVSQPPFSIRK